MKITHITLMAIIFLTVICMGCKDPLQNKRNIEDNPPVLNNDAFWDFIPWWKDQPSEKPLTNSVEMTNGTIDLVSE